MEGPNVTPGYWKNDALTRAAFDEEGYYKFGDAVRFVDPDDVNRGFMYDGRLKEDFKLASGTWVSVGPLRTKIIHAFAPYVTDVVIAGLNRNFLSMLVFPNLEACRSLSRELRDAATPAEILRHGSVTGKFSELLEFFAAQSTGNSNRVARAILLEEPPSLDAGEITDKASLNQRAILDRRADAVEEIYSSHPPARVLRLKD